MCSTDPVNTAEKRNIKANNGTRACLPWHHTWSVTDNVYRQTQGTVDHVKTLHTHPQGSSQTDREQISIKKLHLNFTNPRITILWYARRLDTISVVQNFTYTTNFHIAHCLNSHCHFYEYLCYWYCFHKRHPARKNLCQFPNVLLLTELTQNPSPTSSNFEMKLAKQQRRK